MEGMPRQLRTEARVAYCHSMDSPRIREALEDSHIEEAPAATPRKERRHFTNEDSRVMETMSTEVPTTRPREGRRHFASPPRTSPILGGSRVEWPFSRKMPYLQAREEEEESKDDAVWKRIGIFMATSRKTAPVTPRDAPHRSSCGFVAAQQMPSRLEQLRQSPRGPSRLQHGPGNVPPEQPSVGVRRGSSTHNVETDACIFRPDRVEQIFHELVKDSKEASRTVKTARKNSSSGPLEDGFIGHSEEASLERVAVKTACKNSSSGPLEDGLISHSKEASLERVTVKTARKNSSSGPLEDGLRVCSLSEGHAAALALPRRKNSLACPVEHQITTKDTHPVPAKPVSQGIMNNLPPRSSEEGTRHLIHLCTESAATQHQASPDSRESDTTNRNRTGEEHLQSRNDENHGEVVAKERQQKPGVRSQSVPANRCGRALSFSRSYSPQPPQMSFGCRRHSDASSAWFRGLRGQIDEEQWLGTASGLIGEVVQHKSKASGYKTPVRPFATRLQINNPKVTSRNESKRGKSPDRFENATDLSRKGCEARVQTFFDEAANMYLRSNCTTPRLDGFKGECSIGTTRAGSEISQTQDDFF